MIITLHDWEADPFIGLVDEVVKAALDKGMAVREEYDPIKMHTTFTIIKPKLGKNDHLQG